MMCERCRKNQATINLTEIIKDVRSEIHICEKCAKDIGLNSKLSSFSMSVSEMLSFLELNEINDNEEVARCRNCGLSFIDYRKNEKLGCPECYFYLGDVLKSIIKSYHGEKRHTGKNPVHSHGCLEEMQFVQEYSEPVVQKDSLYSLKIQLDNAVSEERYEDAALIRDEIRNRDDGEYLPDERNK